MKCPRCETTPLKAEQMSDLSVDACPECQGIWIRRRDLESLIGESGYREESCGGHFRSEHQFFDTDPDVIAGNTQPGEAKRDDANFAHVSAWEYKGPDAAPVLHKESLKFEDVHVSIRSYA